MCLVQCSESLQLPVINLLEPGMDPWLWTQSSPAVQPNLTDCWLCLSQRGDFLQDSYPGHHDADHLAAVSDHLEAKK